MTHSLGILGNVSEALLAALRDAGYDPHPAGPTDEVVLVGDRSDPNDLPREAACVAICGSLDAVTAAYQAGALIAVPADVALVRDALERAVAIAADRRVAHGLRSSTLAALEREAILSAMKAASGSTARAAAMLDISVRKVQYKLHEYGVPLTRRGAVKKPLNGA
jgi:DNA-binding NtrC family response regulator